MHIDEFSDLVRQFFKDVDWNLTIDSNSEDDGNILMRFSDDYQGEIIVRLNSDEVIKIRFRRSGCLIACKDEEIKLFEQVCEENGFMPSHEMLDGGACFLSAHKDIIPSDINMEQFSLMMLYHAMSVLEGFWI